MSDQETTSWLGLSLPEDALTQSPAQPTTQATIVQATIQTLARAMDRATAQANAEQAHHRATRPWFKKKRIALPSAVIGLFLVIMVTTGGNDPMTFDLTRFAPQSQVDGAARPATAALGESVSDSRLAFVVTSIHRPGKTLTDRTGLTQTAKGEFVVVRVSVSNTGYQPRMLAAPGQFLVSTAGQRFATSSALSSLTGADTIFLRQINPGHTVYDAPLLFDVPVGTTLANIELHGSSSSTGVWVKLS